MMHYRKGDNIEHEITKESLPFDDCMPKGQQDFLWMHVKGGTKVSNVVTYAKNALDKKEYRTIVWSGSGGGVVKTISCAEILKRDYALYQVTRMSSTSIEEHWKPQMEGLDEIVAHRQIPSLHILMSLDVIDDSVSGLQKPNTKTEFWAYKRPGGQRNDQQQQHPQQRRSGNHPNQRKRQPRQQQQQDPQQQQSPNHQQQKQQNQQQGNRIQKQPRNQHRFPQKRQQQTEPSGPKVDQADHAKPMETGE